MLLLLNIAIFHYRTVRIVMTAICNNHLKCTSYTRFTFIIDILDTTNFILATALPCMNNPFSENKPHSTGHLGVCSWPWEHCFFHGACNCFHGAARLPWCWVLRAFDRHLKHRVIIHIIGFLNRTEIPKKTHLQGPRAADGLRKAVQVDGFKWKGWLCQSSKAL